MLRCSEHLHCCLVDVLEAPLGIVHHHRLAEAVENCVVQRFGAGELRCAQLELASFACEGFRSTGFSRRLLFHDAVEVRSVAGKRNPIQTTGTPGRKQRFGRANPKMRTGDSPLKSMSYGTAGRTTKRSRQLAVNGLQTADSSCE